MATRNALAAGSVGGRRGQRSLAVLMQMLQMMKDIRESRMRRQQRLAKIEAETVGAIGAKRGQTIRQIGATGAQTRRNIGGIQGRRIGAQSQAQVNMVNALLGPQGMVNKLISDPNRYYGRRDTGGSVAPLSSGNVLGPRITY